MKKMLITTLISLIAIAAVSLRLTYANPASAAAQDVKIPILMYHHLTTDEPPQDRLGEMVSVRMFEKQMEYIKASGFNTISAAELRNFLYSGGELPENPILITFDDGYESNYTLAFPVLQRLDMRAVISVIVSSRGRQPGEFMHFTWEEAQAMLDSGLIEIGSHTFDLHDYTIQKLPSESVAEYEDRIFNDFLIAKNSIQNLLGIDPFVFTHPYGMYNEYSQAIASELGFDLQFTVKPGVVTRSSNPLALERINVPGDISPQELLANIHKHMGKAASPATAPVSAPAVEAEVPHTSYIVNTIETFLQARSYGLLTRDHLHSLKDIISHHDAQQLLLASADRLEEHRLDAAIADSLYRIRPILERASRLEKSKESLTYREALNYLRMLGSVDHISEFYLPERQLTKIEFVDLYLQMIN